MSDSVSTGNNRSDAPQKRRGPMHDVWRRYRKSPIAMLGLFIVLAMLLTAIFADFIAPGDGSAPGYMIQDLGNRFQPPGRAFTTETDAYGNEVEVPGDFYIMGTDEFGRDIFARVVHGSRISLLVGFIAVTISMVTGVILGAIAGFYGGMADNLIMRAIDILLSIPAILLAISIAAALEPGLFTVVIAVGIGAVPGYGRIMRASVLSVREQEFIEAARSVGAGDFRIILKHILPNCMAPIIVQATMGMAYAILWAAALSFLGLGIQPPTPEWGAMLNEARADMVNAPHVALFPSLAIFFTVLAFNLLGDGMRDALDPKIDRT